MRYWLRRISLTAAIISWVVTTSTAQDSFIDSCINPSSLKTLVQRFSDDSFHGRFSGSADAIKAAHIIREEFIKAGLQPTPEAQDYLWPFSFYTDKTGTVNSYNVIATIPGRSKPDELVIFSAHFDHIGTDARFARREKVTPKANDSIYNGANDNASGTTSIIHLARYFASLHNNERTLVFIAFSGEEEGLHGSKALAPAYADKKVAIVINMDMVGRPISNKRQQPFITGPNLSSFRKQLNENLFRVAPAYGRSYFIKNPFFGEMLYQRSDNYSFSRQHIIAHTIMATSPFDKYYHTLSDEWETIDYNYMARVIKAIALGSTGFVNGSVTPVRSKGK
jgi:hypothetical protein